MGLHHSVGNVNKITLAVFEKILLRALHELANVVAGRLVEFHNELTNTTRCTVFSRGLGNQVVQLFR